VAKGLGFVIPTARERQNLLVAFAKRNKVVYGKAFDIVRVTEKVDLSDLVEVEKHLSAITIFEIKSTKKKLRADFSGYFFSLTAAEMLVAQSLRSHFKFVFVNTSTGEHLELALSDIFARARAIYPGWSVSF